MNNPIPENIKELIEKALKGTISKEENALLDLWYDTEPPESVAWNGPEKDPLQLKAKLFTNIQDQIKLERPTVNLPFYRTILFKVAASVVLIVSIGYYLMNINQPEVDQLVAAQEQGIKKIILPDGSIVWLKGKSSLSYPAHFNDSTRNVILEGEALFEVAKDKTHPFIVSTGKYSTRVLGTSFNLNTKNQQYKLIVLTGKVQVNVLDPESKTQKMLAVVLPNQRFDQIDEQKGELSAPEEKEKITITKGTEYPMYFEHTPFPIVMERMERKFNVRFEKADYSAYETCSINADLTDQSLKNSLEILASAIGASYKIENQTIMIEGGGCR